MGSGTIARDFTATLRGDRILHEDGRMEFTVTGNLMKGTFLLSRGQWDHADLELMKAKVD